MSLVSPNLIIEKCRQAGIPFWAASKVALDLKEGIDDKMKDYEINRKITESLRKFDDYAASQFSEYHETKVRTSEGVLLAFDRKRITDSLVKETKISRILAEEIAKEVETDIRRLQLKDLSAPLIREMVNTSLIQKKLVKAKMNYTRVGLPVYDIKEIIERRQVESPVLLNELFGNKTLEEYTLTKILPDNISNAYLNSDIFIHGLESFIIGPLAFQNNLSLFLKHGIKLENALTTGPARAPGVPAYHAVRVLTISKNYTGSGTGFDFFNTFLAPYVEGKTDKQIKQFCQSFLYELNSGYHYNDAFTVNFDTKVPDFLKKEEAIGPAGKSAGKYGDYEKEAGKILEIFLKTMIEGDHSKTPFKWPVVCIKHKNDVSKKVLENLPKPCYFINQQIKNKALLYKTVIAERDADGLGGGILEAVSLNLIKYAKESKNESEFMKTIEKNVELTKEIAQIKKEIIKKRLYKSKTLSFLSQFFDEKEYLRLDKMQVPIYLTGLPQSVRLLLKKERYDGECREFTEKLLRQMHSQFKRYRKEDEIKMSLGVVSDIDVLSRFTSQNKSIEIDEDVSSGLTPFEMGEEDRIKTYKELQSEFTAGAFYETSDRKLVNDKDPLFLKIF